MGYSPIIQSGVSCTRAGDYVRVMLRKFQAHPGGPIGVATLLLRGSAALTLFSRIGSISGESPVLTPLTAGIAAALLVGIGTRMATALAVGTLIATLRYGHPASLASDLATMLGMAAIFLTGPGAFSADALRFGRTTLRAGGGPRTTV